MAKELTARKLRKHGKVSWMVDMRGVKGGRAFFPTKEKADKHADDKNAEIAAHGAAAFALTHEQRLSYMEAERRLRAVGANVTEAVDFFLSHRKAHVPKSLRDAIDEIECVKTAAGKSKRYCNQMRYTLDGLLLSVGNDKALCDELTSQQIEKWLANPKWQLRTKKGCLIDLRTFIAFCLKRGYMAKDPATSIEPIIVPRKRPGILSVESAKALMLSARAHEPTMLPYVTLALFCGLRPSEIFRLKWSDVHLDRGFVTVENDVALKTSRRRLVELSDNAKAWLKLGGNLPPVNWQDRLAAIRERAGNGKPFRWPSDCLRHSFCSYHLAQHQSGDKTALQAGHSSQILFEHYRELVTVEDAKAFWEIKP